MRYFIGLVGFPLGIVIVVYRERIKRFTGNLGFAERWFGIGGTYTFYLIVGLVVSVLSVMYASGVLQSWLKAFLGPLFGMPS